MHYSIAVVLEEKDRNLLEETLEAFSEHKEEFGSISIEEFVRQFKQEAQALIDSAKEMIKELESRDDDKDYSISIEWYKENIEKCTKALESKDPEEMYAVASDEYLELEDHYVPQYFAEDEGEVHLRRGNPNGRWDWWVVGGRWRGEVLPVDLEKVDKDTLMYGEYSSFDFMNPNAKQHKYPDGCYVKDISEAHVKSLLMDYIDRIREHDEKSFLGSKEKFIKESEEYAEKATLKDHLEKRVAGYVTLDGEWVEKPWCEEDKDVEIESLYDYLMRNKDAYVVIVDIHS